jgi:hypothetical protein
MSANNIDGCGSSVVRSVDDDASSARIGLRSGASTTRRANATQTCCPFRKSNLRLSISIDGVADGLTDHVDCRVFRDVVTTTPPPMVNAPINEMAVRGDVARRDLLRDVDGTPAFWILETGAH